jgi:serine phosphatase RsbU (regulator of sigma subunit)
VVLVPGEPNPLLLASSGLILGVFRGVGFPARSCRIPAGASLVIFSDGVFEIYRDGGPVWNLDACIAHLATLADRGENLMDQLLGHVYKLRGSPQLDDDFSIIEARFR